MSIRHARQAVRTDELLGVSETLLRRPLVSEAADPTGHTEVVQEIVTQTGAPATAPATVVSTTSSHAPTSVSNIGVPDVNGRTATERMNALRELHESTCPHCTSVGDEVNIVFGEGAIDARLMFIGEAPGAEEDRTGRPFVGRSGQKLDQMIQAMGFARDDVYIANVLKSRPPSNRTPLEHEIDACSPFLAEQIRIIDPTAIVTLGGPASKLLLGTELGITRLRGIWGSFQVGGQTYPVMPTFHPAYLLRNYTAEVRGQVWNDLQAVMARLDDSASE